MASEKVKHKVGRPSLYSDELACKICDRLAKGETLRSICRSDGMPCEVTVWRWESENDEFCKLSARARDRGTHSIAEECIEISDRDDLDPQDRRVRIDTRLRLIGKWNAKKYGDKVEIEQNGQTEVRVVIGGSVT